MEGRARSGASRERRPFLGYAMVWTAATLFAFNGVVSKVVLSSGLSSLRLAQMRSTGALAGLALVLLVAAPRRFHLSRAEIPFLILFGVAGLAAVQLFYLLAIHRLPVGIALLIQYLAPLLVALYARFFTDEPVRRRIWLAIVLAVGGLGLVVQIWNGLSLDGWGVAASLAAAVTFALYVLLAERAVGGRDPVSLSLYGFLFASLFWLVVQPPWTFPGEQLTESVSLLGRLSTSELPVWALSAWVVFPGTILPFALVASALRHIPATRVAIVAMLEPVLATAVAYAWLAESLVPIQLLGV
ncbi:MAG: EamA family transporter, partial [Actinobacteria bacterium]|nr:EamA family transporter [Actinomycetota bacterium]